MVLVYNYETSAFCYLFFQFLYSVKQDLNVRRQFLIFHILTIRFHCRYMNNKMKMIKIVHVCNVSCCWCPEHRLAKRNISKPVADTLSGIHLQPLLNKRAQCCNFNSCIADKCLKQRACILFVIIL